MLEDSIGHEVEVVLSSDPAYESGGKPTSVTDRVKSWARSLVERVRIDTTHEIALIVDYARDRWIGVYKLMEDARAESRQKVAELELSLERANQTIANADHDFIILLHRAEDAEAKLAEAEMANGLMLVDFKKEKSRADILAAALARVEKGEQTMYQCPTCGGNEQCECGSCAKCSVPHDGRIHDLLDKNRDLRAQNDSLKESLRNKFSYDRESLVRELREGFKKRGLWFPDNDGGDVITAVFGALEDLRVQNEKLKNEDTDEDYQLRQVIRNLEANLVATEKELHDEKELRISQRDAQARYITNLHAERDKMWQELSEARKVATDTLLREAKRDSTHPEHEKSGLRDKVRAMMEKRGWSLDWIHRSAYLHLEAAELAEAVRGKRGDTLDESADVLVTLLGLSPHGLDEICRAAEKKVSYLMDAPPYKGEQRA